MQKYPLPVTTTPHSFGRAPSLYGSPHKSASRKALTGLCAFLCLLFFGISSAYGQETEDGAAEGLQNGAPLVYIDCSRCDYDYIRQEIAFVNYVRDQGRADVHVFITDEGTGSGGREYELSFIGRQAFEDLEYTLSHTVDRNATRDETREGLSRVLKMGLAPYVMQTSMGSRLSLEYEGVEGEQATQQTVRDPWNHWVFEIYAGRLQAGLESNQSYFDSRWGFYADRVTREWKTRLRPYFNFHFVEIQRAEDEDPVTSRRHRHGFDSYAIKSLGEHWSAGFFGDYITRNDRNLHHRYRLAPGIEYSVLPYEEATRRAITIIYRIGYSWVDYYQETIFNRSAENLFNHQLEGSVSVEQPWGNIRAGLVGSHYFHDFAQRRAEIYGGVSVRLTEGLSLNFQGDLEMIQDQLSLPRGDASLEEILLQQRELATDFSLSGSIALSYTFGSQYANVVNTRF